MGIIDGQAWEHTYPDDVRKVKEEEKISEEDFRNFIRANHLTDLWETWIKNNIQNSKERSK